MTAPTIADIGQTLGSYWKFKPSEDEITTLVRDTRGWPTLRPLAEAVDYATRNHDDRPTVAWLLRDARRRRAEAERVDTRPGCTLCRGDQWVDQTGDGERPMLAPCPRCRPATSDLWSAGAYALDGPRSDDPQFSHILARHDIEGRQ